MQKLLALLVLAALMLSLYLAGFAPDDPVALTARPFLARAADPTEAEIVANALEANAKVDTLKFNMDMTMGLEGSGGILPEKVTTVANGTGIVDNVKKEMQMIMSMGIEGLPGQPRLDTQAEYYIVGGWMYVKMSLSPLGTQWVKLKMDEEKWKQQQSQVSSMGEWLKTAAEVSLQGIEDVEGVPSYVVRVTPNIEALLRWVTQQQGGTINDMERRGIDVAQAFKRMSVTEWIAKDSYLLTKADVDLLMEFPGGPGKEAEKLSMTVNARMRFFDHNQPVSIVLPEDAANATEMSGPSR